MEFLWEKLCSKNNLNGGKVLKFLLTSISVLVLFLCDIHTIEYKGKNVSQNITIEKHLCPQRRRIDNNGKPGDSVKSQDSMPYLLFQ